MKKRVSLCTLVLLVSCVCAQAGEIYDASGSRVFHTVDTGNIQEVATTKGLRTYREENLVHEATGRTFTYDHSWDQIFSDGVLFMGYHFNKRRYLWLEGTGAKSCRESTGIVVKCSPKDEQIKRIYEIDGDSYTTPDQEGYPILTYQDGNYLDEFGDIVYSLKGPFSGWATIIMTHFYYEQTYRPDMMGEINRRRAEAADAALDSNSIAMDMLALGYKYETEVTNIFSKYYQMIYFTEIDGENVFLKPEQIKRFKNKWLVLNEKTRISSRPFDMPEGGFYLKKKEATKRGIPDLKSRNLVIEIKAKPEYTAEFSEAISRPVESSIQQVLAAAPENHQTAPAEAFRLQSFNYPDYFVSARNYLGAMTNTPAELDQGLANYRLVPGLADANKLSFESITQPGFYLRHQGWRVKLNKIDDSQLFRDDATFARVPGLENPSWSSFESHNYPGKFLRHRNFQLWVESGDTPVFREDATFLPLPMDMTSPPTATN